MRIAPRPAASLRRFPRESTTDVRVSWRESGAPDGVTTHEPVGPTYRVASYTVYPSGYHEVDVPAKERWCLSVVDAGNGWAIRRGDMCLNIALQWEAEPAPALCDAEFLRRCRYNEHAAVLRARRVVDRLETGGFTFDEYVAHVQRSLSHHDAGRLS